MLGRASEHSEGHRVTGGVSRSGSEHKDLCTGSLTLMETDSRALFNAGIELAGQTWHDALADVDFALRAIDDRYGDVPVVLVGHSMGGVFDPSRLSPSG